ncbi:hypothetical protein KBY58_02260 [Cyanobium sp. HWJ4-Hawea]|uniref:hypothetical protein n=1 Tax=Cyanobium sp. HWJ4-Hawea TaxID=2823713 RepID=UPI0020CF28EA|nr:hypothetical protein [Cyanobium sp. HWJ4-Hawea]MCP9808256.1 hypothetical protein [Cyanobium sp. HWJ4-Hawea]
MNSYKSTAKFVLFFFILFTHSALAQQSPGIQDTRRSSSTSSIFSYKIQTTYGATTSGQSNGNVAIDAEAVLRLKSGTTIVNKMGDANGNASATFFATPTGGNVEISGITGENIFLIDDGTYFRSSLTSIDGPDSNAASSGSSSATAVHTTTISVEKGFVTSENYFAQTF